VFEIGMIQIIGGPDQASPRAIAIVLLTRQNLKGPNLENGQI
jgi:hypothetical protein